MSSEKVFVSVEPEKDRATGLEMYEFVRDLFPKCRSITGDGVRQTLNIIRSHLPGLTVHEVPSGLSVFDWTVPDEWNVRSARLIGPDGETVIDFCNNNLHILGYSEPVDVELSLDELQDHLYSLPDMPNAIPYVTSYYKRRWGFCLQHEKRKSLKPGTYRAVIDAKLAPGHLTYGELLIPGETHEEVFLSTYVCHPSMANNELSGPAVTTWLAKWLCSERRRYTYRIVFVPETIGSICYLAQNRAHMSAHTIAGFNVSCVGDERAYSFLESRLGGTLADRVALHVLKHLAPDYIHYTFLDRGSDERQYCAPGIDLPVCSIMRSKYGCYPEYHTSLDNLDLVSAGGLFGAYNALRKSLICIEANIRPKILTLCEPQLGKRGLYPTISTRESGKSVEELMNLIAYSDGNHDLLDIAERLKVPMWDLVRHVERLREADLIAIA